MASKLILVSGGARSGKSRYAQELARKSGQPVLFVATAQAGDEEMRRRIEAHRRGRPEGWTTLESPVDIGESIRRNHRNSGVVLVDCITLLVSNILGDVQDGDPVDISSLENEVNREIRSLIESINGSDATFIVVTNEVGLGLVPPNLQGRLYRDLLGQANQMLAARADEVYFMVVGLPLTLKKVE